MTQSFSRQRTRRSSAAYASEETPSLHVKVSSKRFDVDISLYMPAYLICKCGLFLDTCSQGVVKLILSTTVLDNCRLAEHLAWSDKKDEWHDMTCRSIQSWCPAHACG